MTKPILVVALVMTFALASVPHAEAWCMFGPPTPQKPIPRSSNPSDVLLVGHPPRRLVRDLWRAGHRVFSVPDLAQAADKPYAVVLVDSSEQQANARRWFPAASVFLRTGDVSGDRRSVELVVAARRRAALHDVRASGDATRPVVRLYVYERP